MCVTANQYYGRLSTMVKRKNLTCPVNAFYQLNCLLHNQLHYNFILFSCRLLLNLRPHTSNYGST